MLLHHESVQLIQSSWKKASTIAPQSILLFYQNLFLSDPSLKPLFKTSISLQSNKLTQALNATINSLDNIDSLLPTLHEMGARHYGYGVKPEHYSLVIQALLKTLAQALGDDFTDETRKAWSNALNVIANIMIAAEKK